MKERAIQFIQTHRKKCILFSGIFLLLLLILIFVWIHFHKTESAQATNPYREYAVQTGEVTVGTSESGTVSLEQTTLSFPVDIRIDNVLVKEGYSVKKGETLVALDKNSILDGSLETQTKLSDAELSLKQAVADQSSKLSEAKTTYQKSKNQAQTAKVTAELEKKSIQNSISTKKSDLEQKQKSLTKYQVLQKSYPADYAKLQKLKKWKEDSEKTKSSYESQIETYEKNNKAILDKLDALETEMNDAYSAWILAKANDDDADTEKATYNDAKDAYDNYKDYMNSVVKQRDTLESKLALYNAEYQNYLSAYNQFNDTFKEKYGSASSSSNNDETNYTSDELDDKVTSLQAEVSTAKFTLEQEEKSAAAKENEADITLQTSLNEGNNAQSVYDLTINQLAQDVNTQQNTYDSLSRQLEDVESALNGEGAITAPYDGIVLSISYAAGSEVKADETIATLAKTSAVSISVSLSEEDVTNLSIGQDAEIALTSYEGETFAASVESIAASPSRSGSASVTYNVTAKMINPNSKKVFVGMSGEVTFIQKQKKDVLYVSNQAIQFKDGISSVLIKQKDGTPKETTVVTGFSNGQYVEIVSGLKEGDTVLTESTVTV